MTAYTGTATNVSGSYSLAHHNLLELIKASMEANSWVTLRYDDASAVRELIMQGEGLSGGEEIFVGFRTIESVPSDYYNISLAVFDGYISSNTFSTQPNIQEKTICAHNTNIGYWMEINEQKISILLKVGTPVYELGYAGKYIPYANPNQFPYPVFVGGSFNGLSTTRFSDLTHGAFPFYLGGANDGRMRGLDGVYLEPRYFPFYDANPANAGFYPLTAGSDHQLRDSDAYYPLTEIVLFDGLNVYGELDGIFHIPGFDNAVENTLVINSVDYVVGQNAYRTGFNDYIALRLQ